MNYKVEIEEILKVVTEVEADGEEEARMLAQYLYLAEEIVLTADNHIETNVRLL
ncbi:MAG: DpnD protein [Clostridiales bacterium]|nr:DpnD protein [Clostridiales bacterium]